MFALAATCFAGRAVSVKFPVAQPWSAGTLERLEPAGAGLKLAAGAADGTFTTKVLPLGRSFDRVVPWWNARTPEGAWVTIEARLHRAGKPLSGWLKAATWSAKARGERDRGEGEVTIDQDTFKTKQGADAIELRATLKGGAKLTALGVTAFASGELTSAVVTAPAAPVQIPVPYRTQRKADPELAPRVCGPTSLSMALQFHGVDLPTNSVAALAKDPPGQIQYGNWSYLAATAAELGMDTEVRAMEGLDDVVVELKAGHPVIMALAFGAGELKGAPISKTSGHLVLARGFDKDGNIYVNDPAGHDASDGQVLYRKADLARAWKRGIGIVIRKGE